MYVCWCIFAYSSVLKHAMQVFQLPAHSSDNLVTGNCSPMYIEMYFCVWCMSSESKLFLIFLSISYHSEWICLWPSRWIPIELFYHRLHPSGKSVIPDCRLRNGWMGSYLHLAIFRKKCGNVGELFLFLF